MEFSHQEKTGLALAFILLTVWMFYPQHSLREQTELPMLSMAMVQGNSLLPISPLYYPRTSVTATILNVLNGQYGGQCVAFVQKFVDAFEKVKFEDHPFTGYAGYIRPNSGEPKVGNAILFEKHTAVIISIDGDYLELIESNFNYKELVKVGRFINKNDQSIRGYFDFTLVF